MEDHMGEFEDRVAIVTGAGRGIGQAVATRLAREGARVVVNDLDGARCAETAAAITALGGEAIAVPGDLTDPELPGQVVGAAREAYGTLDVLVNNAGWVEVAPIRDVSLERWSRMLAINLDASFRMLQAVGAQFIIQHNAQRAVPPRHRKIVNVSSNAGIDGSEGAIHYASAKAGVIGMTKSAAREWGRYAINVNAVAFGVIDTRLTRRDVAEDDATGASSLTVNPWNAEMYEATMRATPLGRAGTVDEAAGAIRYLCSSDADYVSGHVLVCSGGS
jgi:3-oxoacyl-[acyl-carrier protein] reductase